MGPHIFRPFGACNFGAGQTNPGANFSPDCGKPLTKAAAARAAVAAGGGGGLVSRTSGPGSAGGAGGGGAPADAPCPLCGSIVGGPAGRGGGGGEGPDPPPTPGRAPRSSPALV